MSEAYSIPNNAGLSIGLRFEQGHFYKWSNQLNAWGMVDDVAAIAALQTITETLAKIPYCIALSAALNAERGSHATH